MAAFTSSLDGPSFFVTADVDYRDSRTLQGTIRGRDLARPGAWSVFRSCIAGQHWRSPLSTIAFPWPLVQGSARSSWRVIWGRETPVWRDGGETMFDCPCPAHGRPEHLHVIGAIMVVHDNHSNEEEIFAKTMCSEYFGKGFANSLSWVSESTSPDSGDNQVLDLGLARRRENRPP